MARKLEIERKFLVVEPPSGWRSWRRTRIEQGYLAIRNKDLEIRLRRKGNRHFLTIKAGRGVSRHEEEIAISTRQFQSLWPLTKGARISKVRYERKLGKEKMELDVYDKPFNKRLMTVEVEFSSLSQSRRFRPPKWFGEEVTGVRKFSNRVLATQGKP